MCHPDAPSGASDASVDVEEASIPLADGEAKPAFVARSATTPSRGVVVVLGDVYGARTPFYEHLAVRLAERGFDAVVPEFFFRVGPLPEATQEAVFGRKAKLDEPQALRDLDEAITWARGQFADGAARVGTLGFCLGGMFVLDLAVMRADLATVCYYGFPAGTPGPPGDPARTAPTPLEQADRMHGPILGFWGELDERVGIPNVEALAQQLTERGVDFEHEVYPGLDHGFLQAGFEPGADGHEQARSSWERTLAFFDQHLTR
jgi:dienelactone hydrolase